MSAPLRDLVPDMIRAYEAGASHREIGEAVGCSGEHVRQLIGDEAARIRERRRAAKRRAEVFAEVDRVIARMKRQGHGTVRRYRMGCRCEPCTAANRERAYAWRATVTPEDAPAHGRRSTYVNYGCRCAPCTEVNSAACSDYRGRTRKERAA